MPINVKVESTGFEDLISDFERMTGPEVTLAAKKATENIAEKLENDIGANARSMLSLKYATGTFLASIGSTSDYSIKDSWAGGSAGVYSNPAIEARKPQRFKGRTEPPAAAVAWWLEFGVQPHSLYPGATAARQAKAGRKARKARDQDKGRQHPGITQQPFISRAYDMNAGFIQDEYIRQFNAMIEGKKVGSS